MPGFISYILLSHLIQLLLGNGLDLNYPGGDCVNLDYSECGILTFDKRNAFLFSLLHHYDYFIKI